MFANPATAVLALAKRYASARGLALSTVSLRCAHQGRFLKRLQDGAGVTPRRATEIVGWFSAHWPQNLEWPDEIPRPRKPPEAA